MKNPERYFEVQFTSHNFSVAELTAFAIDHEARLMSNNEDGALDDLLAAMGTALNDVVGSRGREKTAQAVQKARTAAKNHQRAHIEATVSRQSGLIRSQLGKTSPAYLEFFPRGISEIRRARDAEVPGLLQRMIDAASAHIPQLVPVFQELLDGWNAASGEAALHRAATGSKAQTRGEAFDALRRRLTKNLMTLGLQYLGRPEMASVFFNTSLLYNRQSSSTDELPESPPVTV